MLDNIAIVFATLVGPVLAVQAQRFVDLHREGRKRKDDIFRTLMATRIATLSPDHVRALNLIEIEFGNTKKASRITEAWRAYLAHLNTTTRDDEAWGNRRTDLMVDLLYEMATYLKYPFDKTQIRTSVYSPIAHGTFEEQNATIRTTLIRLLSGHSALHVTIDPTTQPPPTPPQQR